MESQNAAIFLFEILVGTVVREAFIYECLQAFARHRSDIFLKFRFALHLSL